MQNMLWIPHTSFRPLFWVCVIVLQKKTSNIICLCMYGWMDGIEWNGMERNGMDHACMHDKPRRAFVLNKRSQTKFWCM